MKPGMTRQSRLSQEQLKEVLIYDAETGRFEWTWHPSVNRRRRGSRAGEVTKKGHVQIKIFQIAYQAHRLAWLYVYGHLPPMQIDHINNQHGDNRISNLRLATTAQNGANRGRARSNTSGYKGVRRAGKTRWTATIRANNKMYYLGCFKTPLEAHEAYCRAAVRYHGAFARVA